jgi:hypothetical protein
MQIVGTKHILGCYYYVPSFRCRTRCLSVFHRLLCTVTRAAVALHTDPTELMHTLHALASGLYWHSHVLARRISHRSLTVCAEEFQLQEEAIFFLSLHCRSQPLRREISRNYAQVEV